MPRGGDPFVVQVTGPDGPLPLGPGGVDIKDNGDGTYDVTYNPTVHGPHEVDVKLRGKPVGGGPFHVDVKAGADHEHSVVESYSFVIRAKTKSGENKIFGGDDFQVTIDDPAGSRVPEEYVRVSDLGDGTYAVVYSLPDLHLGINKGEYTVGVLLDGKHIKGSPWKQVHG
eukprot:TRINITY_DN3210_c0_g1_i2.p1 TRINITY_DN3210_c0_g1~~TRINITY_DN3210_c0_g1_i2.p1  ORF type:complete len:170 (-),score=27.71 TRINITY_DN3210_c0_g1_i2:66-575(-)